MNLGLFPKFFSKKKTVNEGPTEIGLPTNVLHEIHVSKNLATGLLEGLPTPWLRLLNTQLTWVMKSKSFQLLWKRLGVAAISIEFGLLILISKWGYVFVLSPVGLSLFLQYFLVLCIVHKFRQIFEVFTVPYFPPSFTLLFVMLPFRIFPRWRSQSKACQKFHHYCPFWPYKIILFPEKSLVFSRQAEQNENPNAALQAIKFYNYSIKKRHSDTFKPLATERVIEEESKEIEKILGENIGLGESLCPKLSCICSESVYITSFHCPHQSLYLCVLCCMDF